MSFRVKWNEIEKSFELLDLQDSSTSVGMTMYINL